MSLSTLPPLLSRSQAAAVLGVDRSTIRKAIDAGHLPLKRVSRGSYIPRDAVLPLLDAVSVTEAAKQLRRSEMFVYVAIRAGHIEALRLSKKIYVPHAALDQLSELPVAV